MKVLKFGGTSVGSVESILNLKKIVEACDEPVVVVVSALGGITDKLINTSKLAVTGNLAYLTAYDEMVERHHQMIDAIIEDKKKKEDLLAIVDDLLGQLKSIYQGVFLIGDLSEKTSNAIVSYGERISSNIVATLINNAKWYNSLEFIKTKKKQGKNLFSNSISAPLIHETFKDFVAGAASNSVCLVPGFISTDNVTGEVTNLGRGGSDYTAALVAAALDAELLQIWTDVSGFMTADPRIIPDARIIPEMSFTESMELCSFGAKVIYPPTIYPVFHKNIPIKILNTFRPEDPGTLITDKPKREKVPVTGVSSIADTALVTLCGDLPEDNTEVSSRSLNALAKKGISTYMMGRDSDPHCFSFAIAGADVKNAMRLLNEEFAPELSRGALHEIRRREGLSTIAIVGDSLKEFAELPGQIHTLLMGQGIQVYATASAQSRTTATFVVGKEDVKKGLSIIHSILYPKTAN